jgi:hypothetical protein
MIFGKDRSSQMGPSDKKLQTAAAAALAHIDQLLDEALKATFPAGDPVAISIERGADERKRLSSTEEQQG